ncbi:flagellar biosynthesis protein FlhB [Alginatibacterium sediminis]|uniref:Flagellar biosynthetic protein FlhB n=1 Tax=Alginatibacterium sediminis TaxID=2164068 RepID=A0A420EFQ6_9ALTE|nr:flagellar biosynthesis protein FlhB [Alginatibacterium sediminis]RKF19493.1 flagellar biosynthesis protein FlhB [Alginatibacterium sediminis]
MADTDQERTEDPTEKKLADARKEGQIARSKELGTAAVLISAAIAMMMFGSGLGKGLAEVMRLGFSLEREQLYDVNLLFATIKNMVSGLVAPLIGIMAVILFAAVAGNIALGGMNFSWKAAAPKPSKMSPLKGLKRMFGIQSLVELIKSIMKVFIIAGVVWWILDWQFKSILTLSLQSLPGSVYNALDMLSWMFLALVCSLLLITLVDVPYQIWNHAKQLKMTKQEIKDEHKNSEGNPEVKGRIRRLQMEMAARRMMSDIPTADVIVTNPTHYAVAIRYDQKGTGAPMVVAKGVDEVAMKIQEIARHYDVPIMAAPPLARSIYHTSKIGQEIPEGLYIAVAQILAYVYQLAQFKKGRAGRPKKIDQNFPIPDELKY